MAVGIGRYLLMATKLAVSYGLMKREGLCVFILNRLDAIGEDLCVCILANCAAR